ncbi:hypothetical protein [Staphylococcus hominis]|nr:hypothetical protein [Staphylococcus hominis]
MEVIKRVSELIGCIVIFVGSIIGVISGIGIVKFEDVFLGSDGCRKR